LSGCTRSSAWCEPHVCHHEILIREIAVLACHELGLGTFLGNALGFDTLRGASDEIPDLAPVIYGIIVKMRDGV
jgi:hypothetical protein